MDFMAEDVVEKGVGGSGSMSCYRTCHSSTLPRQDSRGGRLLLVALRRRLAVGSGLLRLEERFVLLLRLDEGVFEELGVCRSRYN